MLQTTIDPSSLLSISTKAENPLQLVISVAGLSWKKDAPFPIEWDQAHDPDHKTARQYLYPWNWKQPPTRFRVFWITKEGAEFQSTGYEDIEVSPYNLSSYVADPGRLIKYYEEILDAKIFSAGAINKNELYCDLDPLKQQEIDVTDDPAGGTQLKETNFYNLSTSQFAQKLSPLNQALNFVYHASSGEKLYKPLQNCVGFTAFPYSHVPDSRWTHMAMPDKVKCHVPADDGIARFSIDYPMLGDSLMRVFSPLTPLPEQEVNSGPIELRDKDGHFKGHVKLQVNDIDDQVPALLGASGTFFDLPRLFLQFLIDNREIYTYTEGVSVAKYEEWLSTLNDFLWVCLRDGLGLGHRKESDNVSMAERLVRRYCNSKEEYKQDFDRIFRELTDKVETVWHADSAYDKAKWISVLKKLSERSAVKDGADTDKEISSRVRQLDLRIAQLIKDLTSIKVNTDVPATPDNVNSYTRVWLDNWLEFLGCVQSDHLLQGRILFEQWFDLNDKLKSIGIDLDTALGPFTNDDDRIVKYMLWYDELFSEELDVRELQKDSIAVLYKKELFESVQRSSQAEDEIARDWLAAIKKYCNNRKEGKSSFFPAWNIDPFENTGLPSDGYLKWQNFVLSIDKRLDEITKDVRAELQRPFTIPPDLQIRVDRFDSKESILDDDLNDEIAGHIVLMHRAQTIHNKDFKEDDWRYLNQAKAVNINDKREPIQEFEKPYIVPAFLPEASGNKMPYLRLTNEKLSLVAGHEDAFRDQSYDAEEEKIKSHLQYRFDPEHKAYALWYGYHYEFSGFVALNSGALPKLLRQNDVWNIPRANVAIPALQDKVPYVHLRRVPISGVRTDVFGDDNKKKVSALPVPKGLLPLSFELPEWESPDSKSVNGKATSAQKHPHYLLAEAENYWQNKLTLVLEKPTTDFWNWYAWLGQATTEESSRSFLNANGQNIGLSGNALDPDGFQTGADGTKILDANGAPLKDSVRKKSIAQVAKERDIKNRIDLNAGREATEHSLNDPAVENAAYIVVDRLFPQEQPNLLKYPIQLLPPKDSVPGDQYLENFANNLEVLLSDDETKAVLDDTGQFIKSLSVKKGDVIRLKIHGLLTVDNLSRFHSWMKDLVTDKEQKVTITLDGAVKECYLTKPSEIWFEAAGQLSGNANNEKTPDQLLWERLHTRNDADNVYLEFSKNEDTRQFAYLSRLEVKHQVWVWNGRLDESGKFLDTLPEEVIRLRDIAADASLPEPERQDAIDRLFESYPELPRTALSLDNIGTDEAEIFLREHSLILDPVNASTTPAMKWEAWAFSDRPDFAALTHETNLVAFRPGAEQQQVSQTLMTDNRPGEEKALYYRFSVVAHSRYELLGAPYNQVIVSKTGVNENKQDSEKIYDKWRRHLRKCTRTQKLPKPAVRFVIPLTKSLAECKDTDAVSSASLLVVLDDRWFSEGGLAEEFELGIEVLENPVANKNFYLNAGNDPILTGLSMGKVDNDHVRIEKRPGANSIALFQPRGPVGLTFDFAVQTPRLKGCAFIVDVPELSGLIPKVDDNQTNRLQPWSLVQIAVRRVLRPGMCQHNNGIKELSSDWSAKEWVQFLPSVDSFIPKNWREQIAKEGHVQLKPGPQGRTVTISPGNELPRFDYLLEERMERFLVVTETAYDIGGQPCEKFVAVYWYNPDLVEKRFELNPDKDKAKDKTVDYSGVSEGYLRLLLVRNYDGDPKESIWNRLFGANATQKPDFNAVQNDPTAALPIVSNRVPYKIEAS